MWTEFEWENRVNVQTTIMWFLSKISNAEAVIDTIHKVISGPIFSILWNPRIWHVSPPMAQCLATAISCLQIYTLAVYLVSTSYRIITYSTSLITYISSIFKGEDALANLSIEKTEVGTITGHVRIRAKTQGIALSLGDRITIGKWIFCALYFTRLKIWLQLKRRTKLQYDRQFLVWTLYIPYIWES